jgi:hypothetical protein
MRRFLLLFVLLISALFPVYAGIFDSSPTDVANEEHTFTNPETATDCPKLLNLPNSCSPQCPEGWKLIGKFDPKTGSFRCQDPNDPKHICEYINPACRLEAFDVSKGIAQVIYNETANKIVWKSLGYADYKALTNGLSFPEWWVHILTLDPETFQKFYAYWEDINKSDSEFATTVKYTAKFFSEAVSYLSWVAFFLAITLGIGGISKIAWDKKREANLYGKDWQHIFATAVKGKVAGFAATALLFTVPIKQTVYNQQTGQEDIFYYPLVVKVVRSIWEIGNKWANELAHKENELFVQYVIDKELYAIEGMLNLHKKLASYYASQIETLAKNLLYQCKEAYGEVKWEEVDISSIKPLPGYKGQAPDPAQCYVGYEELKKLYREYNFHKKKTEEYLDILDKVIHDTNFEDSILANLIKFERMTGWLSASLIPIYSSYAPSILEEQVKNNEQYQEVREKYIKLGNIYGWSKVKAPWAPENDKSVVKGFSDDTNFITGFLIFVARVSVFSQLPPGSFVDQTLTKVLFNKNS